MLGTHMPSMDTKDEPSVEVTRPSLFGSQLVLDLGGGGVLLGARTDGTNGTRWGSCGSYSIPYLTITASAHLAVSPGVWMV